MNNVATLVRQADHWLFHQINQVWTSSWMNAVMPVITDFHKIKACWVIVPLLLAWWIYVSRTRALTALLAVALAAGIADLTCYRLIKPYFHRLRPEQAGVSVIIRKQPHGILSMPSNHAANAFAAARVLLAADPPIGIFALVGAAAIGYSRVYVGAHFPLDVIVGALVGWLIGWLVAALFKGLGFFKNSQGIFKTKRR